MKTWQERCDWTSGEPAAKLMVEAMKEEIAELRALAVPTIPEGFALVPLYYTHEMRAAWESAPFNEDADIEFANAYRLMMEAAPPIPHGLQLVPINPTPKMVDATFNDSPGNESHNARNKRIYAAMLKAAPIISANRYEVCGACDGTGQYTPGCMDEDDICEDCKGKGLVTATTKEWK